MEHRELMPDLLLVLMMARHHAWVWGKSSDACEDLEGEESDAELHVVNKTQDRCTQCFHF